MDNNKQKENKKVLGNVLDDVLGINDQQDMDCSSGVCVLKSDKSIVERINKKIIIEDGRQLLL
jgi:hypothetical protein